MRMRINIRWRNHGSSREYIFISPTWPESSVYRQIYSLEMKRSMCRTSLKVRQIANNLGTQQYSFAKSWRTICQNVLLGKPEGLGVGSHLGQLIHTNHQIFLSSSVKLSIYILETTLKLHNIKKTVHRIFGHFNTILNKKQILYRISLQAA